MRNEESFAMSEEELKKFLILGSEKGVYVPREEALLPIQLTCIDDLIANSKEDRIVEILSDFATNKLVNEHYLALVLALCVKSDRPNLTRAAHAAFSSICHSSQMLFKFIKILQYVSLRLSSVRKQKVGLWGEGLRKAIKKWYGSKDAKTLAAMLVAEKSLDGWSHRDILKLIHFKAPNPEIDATIKYFAFGNVQAQESLDENSKVLAKKVEELKSCEDALRVAALLSDLKLNPPAIPSKFHNSSQVWTEYIKSLPLSELLQRLEYFTSSKSLSATVLPAIITLLKDADGSSVDPAEVFIVLRHYEISNRHKRKEKAMAEKKKKKNAAAAATAVLGISTGCIKKVPSKERGVKAPPKPCPAAIAAVQSLLTRSLATLPCGQKEWLVALDFPSGGASACTYVEAVSVGGAAALTALYAKSMARTATIVAPGEGIIQLEKDANVAGTVATFKKIKTELKGADKSFEWALAQKRTADMIVIISAEERNCEETLKKAKIVMENYRAKEAKPDARLVMMFLRTHRIGGCEDPNILTVCGFGPRILRIVNAFANGQF